MGRRGIGNKSETEYQNWLSKKLSQAMAEEKKRDAREIELFQELGYTAFTDELRKETERNADVNMEDAS